MKPKKNPDKNLNLKRGLFFVIGLFVILVIIYIAFEWKSKIDMFGFDVA